MSGPTLTRDVNGHISIDWHTTDNVMPTHLIEVVPELIVEMIDAHNRNLPTMSNGPASATSPIYSKVLDNTSKATPLYFIICNEGWRESIVCSGMYEWTADWLLKLLGRNAYAPEKRR